MADQKKSTDSLTGRRTAGRPPRDVAQAIDERLLDAARALFCRKGIAGASMEEVADEAGIAKQTIYRRYPGKAALIDAVVARDLDRMLAQSHVTGATPLERLHRMTLNRFHYALEPENLLFVGFLLAEAAYSPPLRERFRDWSDRIHAPVLELLREAQAAGEVQAGDVMALSRLLDDLTGTSAQLLRLASPRAFDGMARDDWFALRWQAFLTLVGQGF